MRELSANAEKGQPFTMFTEFTRQDRHPLSAVIESIDYLLDNKLVTPRFAYPGMERISITLNDKGRRILADHAAQHPPAASLGSGSLTA